MDDSDRAFTHKRVRVEQLLEKLLLDGKAAAKTQVDYDVNPLLDFSDDRKRKKRPGIDSVISEKIRLEYKDQVLRGLTMIRYMPPITIIILHFHAWVKRLFNNFIRKYNRTHAGQRQVGFFRSFYKIMAMVEDPRIGLTYANLYDIVIRESEMETRMLVLKKSNKLDSKKIQEIRDEESLARECNYKYWDRMGDLPEVDMDDVSD